MVFLLFLVLAGLFAYIMFRPNDQQSSQESERSKDETHPRTQALLESIQRGREKAVEPPVKPSEWSFRKYFESSHCDSCTTAPLVQFKKNENEKRSILEFCGHHGNRNEDRLILAGFKKTFDARDKIR